jgi:hypothetical protein
MEVAITSAIGGVVDTIESVGTAAMAVVIAFMIWRKVRAAGNKV